MPLSSAARKKNGQFGPTSKKEWTEIAKQELGKEFSLEKLAHRIDGIDLLPFYDRHDLPAASGFHLSSSQNEFQEPRSWLNVPRISTIDPTEANRKALTWLNNGADGILFELKGDPDPAILFRNIKPNYCHTSFLADPTQENFFQRFTKHLEEKKIDRTTVSGSIFWSTAPRVLPLLKLFDGWDLFHALGTVAPSKESLTEGIASLLAQAVIQIDQSTKEGIAARNALQHIAFLSPIGLDFFQEVAKLKVVRMLWSNIARAYDPTYSRSVNIHSLSNSRTNPTYEPHGNMLKATVGSLSAVLGGCDALTIEASEPAMERLALNISSILKEEAHLGKVSDPTAGSYYLENLIDRFARHSWKKFQTAVR